MYPGEKENPSGKLRLMYEVAPLAMVVEQAGGRASDGHGNVMDIEPESLHMRTPVYMGSSEFVDLAERILAEAGE
jgi:fructose-1,6-bisphosphatase I